MLDILSLLCIALGFTLVSLVAGNNVSVCFGSAIASRATGRRAGILLSIIGYAAGFLLQGKYLSYTVATLLSSVSLFRIDCALLIAIVIFIIADIKRVPQALTITLTAILIGMNVAMNTGRNVGLIASIITFWITMPILSFFFMLIVMKWLDGRAPKRRIWSYARLMRFALIVVSFFTAFTLGANTIGLIWALIPQSGSIFLLAIAAIIIGSTLLSAGTLGRVGNDIIPLRYMNAVGSQFASALVVEIATLFRIPLTSTESFISSVYGAGVSYKRRVIRSRPLVTIVSMWMITALVSFAAGFAVIVLSSARI